MGKFIIWRHQEYITINPKEYLLDNHGKIMKFDTAEQAINYLNKHFKFPHLTEDAWKQHDGIYVEEENDEST